MTKENTTKRKVLTFILALLMIFELFITCFGISASAADLYSSPLQDLQASSTFDVRDYPSVAGDYSINVISIAESSEDELYVYVYQPSAETKVLTATSITIDVPLNNNERNFRNYKLRLLGTQGVFQKYVVESLVLRENPVRKYSISEIFRAFDSSIDIAPDNDNTISEKAYAVGKMWTLKENNGSISTELVYEDVIDVTEKHVGYVKYDNTTTMGLLFGTSDQVHSHYIAFSTDRPIDDIKEVDVMWNEEYVYTYVDTPLTTKTERTDKGIQYKTLSSGEVLEINETGIFPDHYKYKRIQSVASFFEMEEKDIQNEDVLEGKEWILRFYETRWFNSIKTNMSQGGIDTYDPTGTAYHTNVTDVALLRIEYEYDGKIYNLGVVDDKQTGSKNPDGSHGGEDLLEDILALLGLLVFIVALMFLGGPISFVLKVVYDAIKFIIKALIWVISIPFKIIGWIFRR